MFGPKTLEELLSVDSVDDLSEENIQYLIDSRKYAYNEFTQTQRAECETLKDKLKVAEEHAKEIKKEQAKVGDRPNLKYGLPLAWLIGTGVITLWGHYGYGFELIPMLMVSVAVMTFCIVFMAFSISVNNNPHDPGMKALHDRKVLSRQFDELEAQQAAATLKVTELKKQIELNDAEHSLRLSFVQKMLDDHKESGGLASASPAGAPVPIPVVIEE